MNAKNTLYVLCILVCAAERCPGSPRDAQLLKDVVKAQQGMAPERARAINAALDRTVGKAPELDRDCSRLLASGFGVYAEERLWPQIAAPQEQFDLAVDTMAWVAENAVGMPAPTADQVRFADDVVEMVVELLAPMIDQLYPSLAAKDRAKLVQDATGRVKAMRSKVCNPFYPEMLRPASDSLSREDALAALLERPGLQNAQERYQPVAGIQRDTSLPEGSRQVHIDFFVEREAQNIERAVADQMRAWFIFPAEAHYTPMPEELQARYREQRAQLEERVKREQEERARKQMRPANPLVKVLKDSGVQTSGGRPVPPKR